MKSMYQFPKKTIKDVELTGKRVLVRVDYNVPLDSSGKIDSDFRIRASLPTLQYLIKQNCEIVLLAHLGRPGGKPDSALSLEPIATRLSELLKLPVAFCPDVVGDRVVQTVKGMKQGEVVLLENVRFYPQEEKNDSQFAKKIIESVKPDYVVQDGFGVVHRAHASTEGISHVRPAVAGILLEQEAVALEGTLTHPQRPLVAIIGGAKITDKLPLIDRFLDVADTILIGGALANTFLFCADIEIGNSVCEKERQKQVREILQRAKPGQIILPKDVGTAKELAEHAKRTNVSIDAVHKGEYILDIGPVTAALFSHYIESAGTVIWNGTLGYAENPRFQKGSAKIADAISAQGPSLISVIGGGDTADFVQQWLAVHKKRSFTHISTGGGASLELLSGKKLPGIEALLDRARSR